MRVFVLTIVFFFAHFSFSQLTIKPIVKKQQDKNGRTKSAAARVVAPATIPFWDDFSVTTDSPDSVRVWGSDSTRQWNYELSRDVFVNATLAINPPSYRVATFDGLDVNGNFHTDVNPWADQLVSDTVDLQGVANVVLSFYWQAGGNVELPEEGDSLRLQFYDPNVEGEKWISQWSVDGSEIVNGEDSIFTQVAIPVAGRFLTQDFVFRFQSFGDKDGPFDAWHLDWIYLNDDRGSDDYFYEDRSINEQLTSPFAPFKSLPISQFKENPLLFGPLNSGASNLADEPDLIGPPANYILTLTESSAGATIDSRLFTNQGLLGFNPDPFRHSGEKQLSFEGIDLSTIPQEDSLVLSAKLFFEESDDGFLDGSIVDLQVNDTVQVDYLLQDYYAFDDGTAEFAAGTNINGGQVAVQFWVQEADTLTHVDIHFPNIDPPSGGRPLTLNIFRSLDGRDPIRSQQISIQNGTSINSFARYQLQSPVVLSDTFFVAYQQSVNEYIGVGFDRSNPQASSYIFENRAGQWEQNDRLEGALMIRAVFSSTDSLVTNVREVKKLSVYPNPTNGPLKVDGSYQSITIIDFSGRIWLEEESKSTHDLTALKQGLYLLKIHRKEGDQTLKIIKQ